jgi:hypothetical protein
MWFLFNDLRCRTCWFAKVRQRFGKRLKVRHFFPFNYLIEVPLARRDAPEDYFPTIRGAEPLVDVPAGQSAHLGGQRPR